MFNLRGKAKVPVASVPQHLCNAPPPSACLPSFLNNCPLTALQQVVSLLNLQIGKSLPWLCFLTRIIFPQRSLRSVPLSHQVFVQIPPVKGASPPSLSPRAAQLPWPPPQAPSPLIHFACPALPSSTHSVISQHTAYFAALLFMLFIFLPPCIFY